MQCDIGKGKVIGVGNFPIFQKIPAEKTNHGHRQSKQNRFRYFLRENNLHNFTKINAGDTDGKQVKQCNLERKGFGQVDDGKGAAANENKPCAHKEEKAFLMG